MAGYEPIHMLNYLLFLLKQWIKQGSTIVKVLGRFGSLAVQIRNSHPSSSSH